MDFELTELQTELATGVRRLCEGQFGLDHLRTFESTGKVVERKGWQRLGEAGVFNLCLGESDGGVGLGLAEAALVFEELGRALVPGPLVASHLAAGFIDGAGAGSVVVGLVEARKRSVAGASVAALISRASVSANGAISSPPNCGCGAPTTSVRAEDASTDDVDGPLVAVPPSLRSNIEVSGARTATCLTASWPRSIDCATKAVPMVAAAEPIATPTIVPLTPKVEATRAAMTAPAVEARIWRSENFTPGV